MQWPITDWVGLATLVMAIVAAIAGAWFAWRRPSPEAPMTIELGDRSLAKVELLTDAVDRHAERLDELRRAVLEAGVLFRRPPPRRG